MTHEAGGCCSNMAAKDATAPVDHAAMNHDSPAADVKAMDHAAGGGCCGNMAAKMTADQKPGGMPKTHDAGMSCCSHMAMNHDAAKNSDTTPKGFGAMSCPSDAATNNSPAADATAAGHDHAAAGGCCASMASDKSAGGCCADMAKKPDSTK
ncbi:MAG: hypothetical protein ABMA15_20950 [Vicinamibacterales bacterium]